MSPASVLSTPSKSKVCFWYLLPPCLEPAKPGLHGRWSYGSNGGPGSIPRSPEDNLPRCSPRPQPQGHREEKQWKQMVRSKMSWEAAKHPGTKGNPSSKGIPRGACQTDRAVSTSQKFLGPSKLSESAECFSSPNRGTKVRRLLLDGSEITPCGKREELKPPENQLLPLPSPTSAPHGWLPTESK